MPPPPSHLASILRVGQHQYLDSSCCTLETAGVVYVYACVCVFVSLCLSTSCALSHNSAPQNKYRNICFGILWKQLSVWRCHVQNWPVCWQTTITISVHWANHSSPSRVVHIYLQLCRISLWSASMRESPHLPVCSWPLTVSTRTNAQLSVCPLP